MKKTPANASFKKVLTAQELAAQSGVAISAIHFYESKSLIASWRTPSGRRRYTADQLRRVLVIKAAQSVDIPLSTIGEILTLLPRDRDPSQGDWGMLLDRCRIVLDDRLSRLATRRAQLASCSSCGCLSATCPLVSHN